MDHRWAIETAGLGKVYGSVQVLDGVDLQVSSGTVFSLLGPNGSGKTTIVRILATLTTPDRGNARVSGFDVVADRHQVRRRISLTGQYASLDEGLSGTENLRMLGRLLRLPGAQARSRAAELLDAFDLVDAGERRVSTYSGGMRRRLDLAASLVGSPELVFLDEPTTGLDLHSRLAVWEVIEQLAADGVTVFLTTQYLDEAERLADQVAVLDRGRVVAQGSVDELKARVAGQRLDLTLADRPSFDQVSRDLGDRLLVMDPSDLVLGVATDGSARDVRRLLDQLDPLGDRVVRFQVRSATLDDVFLALTGHQSNREPADV